MNSQNKRLTNTEIGERVRLAREAANITQADAAKAIGVARTTIVAIEKGQRRIKVEELQKIACHFGITANAIMRREAVHLDLVPQFRKLENSSDDDVAGAAQLLNELVSAELELENALGVQRNRNYPPERQILPGNVIQQAEHDAQALRDWLGLGPGPIVDILSLLELELGIRIYVRRLKGKVSALFAYNDAVGACILLNANHPQTRLVQSASHELGHFVATRRQPEILNEQDGARSRSERYASAFGRSFLTPGRVVRQRFAEITAGQSHLTRRHVILLSNVFGVGREAMVRRLEELELAKYGTWDWFLSNGGITDEHVLQVLGKLPSAPSFEVNLQSLVPPRLSLLAREVWKNSLYSEGQLAQILKLDRHQVRELLDGVEREESEADDIVKLSE